MALQIGDTAPDFEAETTEGTISFHDWIGDSGRCCSRTRRTSRPCARPSSATWRRSSRSSTPERQGHRAVGRPGRQPRAVGTRHRGDAGARAELSRSSATPTSTCRSSTGCCRRAPRATRTSARRPTTRRSATSSSIGPDKKVKLILVYPMTTGTQLRRGAAGDRLAAADGGPQGVDAGELAAGRRRDHRRLGLRRRGQETYPAAGSRPSPTSGSSPSRADPLRRMSIRGSGCSSREALGTRAHGVIEAI